MTLFRLFAMIAFLVLPLGSANAQDAAVPVPDRSATGGAQTLEDILARQRGIKIDDTFRRSDTGNPEGAAATTNPLGTLGGASDPELWRALRFGSAEVVASSKTPGSTILVQDSGITWLNFRDGPLRTWGGYALLAVLVLLALFYLGRGRIRIESGFSGITIERFKPIERFGHWLLAGSFILLGITGMISLFGRVGLLPWMGHETYATLAQASKWIHNNVSWAFMIGLAMVFVMWIMHNLPNRHDLRWIMKGGGLFSKHSHPPAKKFNAGQKIIFWSVLLMGISISASGLALLFPFQLPMFTKTFVFINEIGAPGWVGLDPLPTNMPPHQEMQLALAWHSILAFAMLVVIVAHIYIGSIGMEGAFAAMGDGRVDLHWAQEHHSIWVEETHHQRATPENPPPAE